METQSKVRQVGANGPSIMKWLAVAVCFLGAGLASAAQLAIKVVGVGPDGKPLAAAVTSYRWTVEEDATKLSVPGVPATPANYSFSFHTSYMPVIAAGRAGASVDDLTARAADPDYARLQSQTLPDLDPGKRYYVSVAAEGFQMGGGPVVFTTAGDAATATVYVNKYEVPAAQVSVFVFNDNSPINGAPDLPQETGLAGFTVQLTEAGGHYGQSGGAVTQDGFGNPLGTTYNADGSVKHKGNGIILTGPDGVATIKNLFPAKYTIFIAPPPKTDWVQTSTIEGTRGIDAWVKNNEPAFFQEFGPPGHHVFTGFTKPGCIQGTAGSRCVGLTGGTPHSITGRIVDIHNSRPPIYNFEPAAPVPECWVGLNEFGGGTRALYATPCKKDSTFVLPNVPAGTYEMVVWDTPLDVIIASQTITVGNGNRALGDVPVFSWFGRYQGRVFQDIDGSGLPFFAEAFNRPYIEVDPVTGVETAKQKNYAAGELKPAFGSGIASNIRFRDGSIYQSAVTKQDGTFAFTELFPFFNWMVAEIDYARFKATGATVIPDAGGRVNATENAAKLWAAQKGSFGSSDPALAYDPWIRLNPQLQTTCTAAQVAANLDANGKIIDPTACFKVGDKYYRSEQGVILLEGMQTFLGQTNHIEWGKQPYAGQLNGLKDENGGIAGIVHYAITRAEDDPRYATAENWEPGIPRVQVDMFLDCDGDGKIDKPMNDGTGQCASGGLSGVDAYVADLPDVDNYPFCWRDPQSCGLSAGARGPEDVKRSALGGDSFSYGDVFGWGGPGQAPGGQLHVGLGKTDAWDDSIPTGCVKSPSALPVGNGGIPFTDNLDCFDGLYNFNQLRPSVFDGGYAFGRVAGQAELPVLIGAKGNGTYIIEAVAPMGYLHQGNGDKNVVFGDSLQAATAVLPASCTGMELEVPQYLTLFPGEANPNYTGPGQTWRKCDMKAVPLAPGMNAAADFYMFTEAPVAGHGVGFILDDTASEFNRFAPTFGEKYAPPHLPVSVQDWTGREISRVYSDQFGSYNFLTPSSFTVNPPFPSGVMPNMMVSCMNHPGPVKIGVNSDGSDKMGIDPYFNRKYTQFCYTLQYLSGKTTYLDTPVLPIAAFATVEKNPLDCECQDKTPAIYSVNNPSITSNNGNNGPWVPAAGGTLTIVSDGVASQVPNPAYDPTLVGSPKLITRDYSFGATVGTVRIGTRLLNLKAGSSWNSDILEVVVPANTPSGQLTITRGDNGKTSDVGLYVHVGGNVPKVVQPGASIQALIDAPTTHAGDLIMVPPGTYNEYLILDKRLRLQGWGAKSVTINASKASTTGLSNWRKLLNTKVDARCALPNGSPGAPAVGSCPANTPVDPNTGGPTIVAGPNRSFDPLPGQALGIDAANNEPILFGAEEGPGILVVGKAGSGNNACANSNIALRLDGLSFTGSDSGGGILASGYNCNLQVTNNRVVGNYGTYGGGVRVGHTALINADNYSSGFNAGVVIEHNWIAENGASEIASGDGGGGGITMGNGSNNYRVSNNYVCGNFSMSDGGGIAHVGQSSGGVIANNRILLNQTFNQSADPSGGGLSISAQVPLAGTTSDGTGDVTVDSNLIQYNHAGAGAGGGVSISRTAARDDVLLTNNMIVNNAAAFAGGGVALANVTSDVRLVNNTIADNVSTATNRQSFPAGPKVLSTPQIGGVAKLSGNSNPTLLNNIIWNNHSFTWSITPTDPNLPQTTALTDRGVWDMGVVGNSSKTALPSSRSVVTANAGNDPTAIAADAAALAFVKRISFLPQTDSDQPGVLPETTIMSTALTFDEGGNFINVNFSPLTPWDMTLAAFGEPRADYHLRPASVAINAGANRTGGNGVPLADIDAQVRTCTDVGADEVTSVAALAPTLSSISPASGARPATNNGSNTYVITLTGSNLNGATLTENTNGFTLSNVVLVNSTTITASLQVQRSAGTGNKAITVSTCAGAASINFNVTN